MLLGASLSKQGFAWKAKQKEGSVLVIIAWRGPRGSERTGRIRLMPEPGQVQVNWSAPEDEPRARAISALLASNPQQPLLPPGMSLNISEGALELHSGKAGELPLTVTFEATQGRPGSLRAVLAGQRPPPRIIDATAGLGSDAFDFAAAGCQVVMLERSPVIAALLADGLERARHNPDISAIASQLTLLVGEAAELLPGLAPADVIYLDPMFEPDANAGKRKAMRLFQELTHTDSDSSELLHIARQHARQRVTVKRSRRAPFLGGVRPSGSINGRTIRFDLYAPVRQED